jgi:hypothetical protein
VGKAIAKPTSSPIKSRGSDDVQQKLMRHADPHTTLEYGDALDHSKRKATSRVAKLVLVGKRRPK